MFGTEASSLTIFNIWPSSLFWGRRPHPLLVHVRLSEMLLPTLVMISIFIRGLNLPRVELSILWTNWNHTETGETQKMVCGHHLKELHHGFQEAAASSLDTGSGLALCACPFLPLLHISVSVFLSLPLVPSLSFLPVVDPGTNLQCCGALDPLTVILHLAYINYGSRLGDWHISTLLANV